MRSPGMTLVLALLATLIAACRDGSRAPDAGPADAPIAADAPPADRPADQDQPEMGGDAPGDRTILIDGPDDAVTPIQADGGACFPGRIGGPACDDCLAARCCQESRRCPEITGSLGSGCPHLLRCARECPDGGGTCRIRPPAFAVADGCANGFGPGGANLLLSFQRCVAMSCAEVCALTAP